MYPNCSQFPNPTPSGWSVVFWVETDRYCSPAASIAPSFHCVVNTNCRVGNPLGRCVANQSRTDAWTDMCPSGAHFKDFLELRVQWFSFRTAQFICAKCYFGATAMTHEREGTANRKFPSDQNSCKHTKTSLTRRRKTPCTFLTFRVQYISVFGAASCTGGFRDCAKCLVVLHT